MKTYRIALAIGFILITQNIYAQLSTNAIITDIDIRYFEDKIFVPYTIARGNATVNHIVWVNFFNENKERLNAKTIGGDVDIVKGTGSKLISWDVKADGIILNEKVYAEVNVKVMLPANLGKAFAYSTLFPGAGHSQYKKKGAHWIKGVIGYGLVGSSIGTSIASNNAYDKYRNSDLPSTEDPNFNTAKQYKQTAIILAGVGMGVWLIEYAGIISKSSKHKNAKPQSFIVDPDYRQYTACSQVKHINTRGLPPNLFAELYFHDENNNGILEARENAELKVILSNRGSGDAMNLEINVSTNVNDKGLGIQNANQKINVLRPGENKEIKIPITTNIDLKTAIHKFTIKVLEEYGYDMAPAYLVLNTYAYQPPSLVVSGHEVIDIGMDTYALVPDSKLQAGEQVKVKLLIQNIGHGVAKAAHYTITTSDANIFLGQTDGIIGDIAPGEVKELFFSLSPNRRVTTKDNLPIFLSITEEVGRGSIKDNQLPIALDQTPPKPNIVEVKSDVESLTKNIARFEYSSSKFRTSTSNVINIATVAPSKTKIAKSVGVVIGVGKYKELPPAPYADNDARIMKEYFEKILGVEQVILFTNEQVSGFFFDDIFSSEIGELRKAVVRGETEVFVYYSGHGIPDKDGKNIFLFPHDGRVARLESQGYNLEKLYENLTKLEAKHVTVILDACFSGASRSTARIETENLGGQKGVRVRPRYRWVGDPTFTVISSSTGEETSLGFDETETGLFTYYLAAGLMGEADANGDKTITLGELKEYVTSNVKETSTRMRGLQTPMFHGDDDRVLVIF
jgi:hypothetical protein